MSDSEDDIGLAAEYALGTLAVAERAEAERRIASEARFAALVQSWLWRLGALNQMVGPVEPRPVVWDNIKSAIAAAAVEVQPAPAADRPALPPVEAQVTAGRVDPSAEGAPLSGQSNVIRLDRAARRWRGVAGLVSALAAALVALVGLQLGAPDYLPEVLRPSPRTKVVQVKPPPPQTMPAAQYVALLQGAAGGPAFILTVDGASKTFSVRKVGAAPADPDKSYELWLISDRLGRPRSLGVIGATDFTVRPWLASYDADTIRDATYAVTIEQAGGAPDGNPHSAPVYTGKLIETVPPPAAVQTQQR